MDQDCTHIVYANSLQSALLSTSLKRRSWSLLWRHLCLSPLCLCFLYLQAQLVGKIQLHSTAQHHLTLETIAEVLPNNFRMPGLDCWLSVWQVKRCIAYRELQTRVALTCPVEDFFSQPPLIFGSVTLLSERPASLD